MRMKSILRNELCDYIGLILYETCGNKCSMKIEAGFHYMRSVMFHTLACNYQLLIFAPLESGAARVGKDTVFATSARISKASGESVFYTEIYTLSNYVNAN
jgi:hypothetical protein